MYYDNLAFDFKISENIRERLLNGYDDIELTLKKSREIKLYETRNYNKQSWKLVEHDTQN